MTVRADFYPATASTTTSSARTQKPSTSALTGISTSMEEIAGEQQQGLPGNVQAELQQQPRRLSTNSTSSASTKKPTTRSWIPLSFRDVAEDRVLNVLTYNILSDEKAAKEEWATNVPPFQHRKGIIVETIAANDLIALQEVGPAVFSELKKQLDESYDGVFFQPSIPPCGVAVFARKSRLKIARYDGFQIEDSMCLQCEIRMLVNGKVKMSKKNLNNKFACETVHFFAIHFCGGKQPGDEERRARHLKLLHENAIEGLITDPAEGGGEGNNNSFSPKNIIVACDSNSERTFAPVEELEPVWYGEVKRLWLEPGLFQDAVLDANLLYTTKKMRTEGKITQRAVDYIFVSCNKADNLTVHGVLDVPRYVASSTKRSTIAENLMPNEEYVSDHLPVVCKLSVGTGGTSGRASAEFHLRKHRGFLTCIFGVKDED
ncbi:unnamed protein product [Amoebophrya sp. A120]|nr:unnamed protein product [Amoebophrya sp. A120]|eukprot:GSA120T00022612001.1